MKLSIATIAHSRPEIDSRVLERLMTADDNAIGEIASALQSGKLSKNEMPHVMSHIVNAMVEQDSLASKTRLRDLYMKIRDSLGSVSISSDEKDNARIFDGMAEVTGFHLDAIQRYDDIVWLAFLGAELGEKMEEMTKGKVISTGAVLARADRGEENIDSGFREVARKCLVNALYNGGAWTKFHASEVLEQYYGIEMKSIATRALGETLEKGSAKSVIAAEMYLRQRGIDAKDAAIARLTSMLKTDVEGAARALLKLGVDPKDSMENMILEGGKEALEAYLSIYEKSPADLYSLAVMAGDKPQLRQEISLISKSVEDRHLAKMAGKVMAFVRNRDEIDSAESDRDFLLEHVLVPEMKYPTERLYVEMVFDAVIKVLDSYNPSVSERKTATTLLCASGANPGALSENLDSHTMKVIARNVENALLHALNYADCRERAAEGLEKIGSDRIENVLERIVEREGELGPTGIVASETLARISGRKIEKDIILIDETVRAPRPPPIPKAATAAKQLRIN